MRYWQMVHRTHLAKRAGEREERVHKRQRPLLRVTSRTIQSVQNALQEERPRVVEHDADVGQCKVQKEVKRVRFPDPLQQLARRPRELDVQRTSLHRRTEGPDVRLVEGVVHSPIEQGDDPAERHPAPYGRVVLGRDRLALTIGDTSLSNCAMRIAETARLITHNFLFFDMFAGGAQWHVHYDYEGSGDRK